MIFQQSVVLVGLAAKDNEYIVLGEGHDATDASFLGYQLKDRAVARAEAITAA